MTGEVTELSLVNGADLFDQDPRRFAVDLDLGPERRGPCAYTYW